MNSLLANIIITILSIAGAILIVHYAARIKPNQSLNKLLIGIGILMGLIGLVMVAK